MGSPIIKPGDVVRTPSGRTAEVDRLRPDGKRDLRYLDGDRAELVLPESLLKLVRSVPPRRWPSHKA